MKAPQICTILHISRKPNSIIMVKLFVQMTNSPVSQHSFIYEQIVVLKKYNHSSKLDFFNIVVPFSITLASAYMIRERNNLYEDVLT